MRDLKRTIRLGLSAGGSAGLASARESAVALLEHSVRKEHERLALLRLGDAIRMGANIRADVWRYCEAVANRRPDVVSRAILAMRLPAATNTTEQTR
ncbi:hypothetical protein [Ramlibacter sp. WS9]|uniref:hypothetical protein n=1 Tax=Ramlibacter sp. WS9 TaxID=1882741 RepID=UPI001142F625|nr:hypothetical protein [Ramlibacter sp. WS9]